MKTNAQGIVAAAIACALTAGSLAGTALASPAGLTFKKFGVGEVTRAYEGIAEVVRINGAGGFTEVVRIGDDGVAEVVRIGDGVEAGPRWVVRDGAEVAGIEWV